jgi:cell division protein FtsQ
MSIDPRLMERRKTVAEDNAKKNISRLLKFLMVVVFAGASAWLLFSPWLSVDRVETDGVNSSAANSILAELGVRAGAAMILIDPGKVEDRLLEDPWIAQATVSRAWPDLVTVHIEERFPVAWVRSSEGWARRAVDGVALPSAPEPDDSMGRIEMSDMGESGATSSIELLGALEFMSALDSDLHDEAVVSRRDGELWATVAGFEVRLGRSTEMAQKALSLAALLEEGLEPGTLVNLIAPTHPATIAPSRGEETAEGDSNDGAEETAVGEQSTESESNDDS